MHAGRQIEVDHADTGPAGGADNGPAHTSAVRLAVADRMRALGNALVAHQVDDTVLERIAGGVDELLSLVTGAPERPHAFIERGVDIFSVAPPEGGPSQPRSAFPDCVVSGLANPMGMGARLWREGEEAVCRVTLGAAFEGAPGRAHGGVVAALIDETMGLVLSISATPAFTGRLGVTYRAPTPVGQPLEGRARMTARTGRKMTIVAELTSEGRLLAEGSGLFIAVDPERFFVAGG